METEFIRNERGTLLAILIRRGAPDAGLKFFTEPDAQLQVACMAYPAGYQIPEHIHKPATRVVVGTPEVIFVRRGSVLAKIGVYSRTLEAGDCLVLLLGSHGFTFLEDGELFEVKQGPYLGKDDDKVPVTLWEGGPTY
jgi:mannose-6-phosphate isomerase-like protein (cupin superfamily)